MGHFGPVKGSDALFGFGTVESIRYSLSTCWLSSHGSPLIDHSPFRFLDYKRSPDGISLRLPPTSGVTCLRR